jgi:opacity protein-like surface antigen
MRSRRNQGKCLLARNHKRNLYQRRLSPLHAERYGPPLRPVMGGEWMMGKFASVTATARVLALLVLTSLVLTILLGAQGFAQTTPAGQAPATPPGTPAPAAQQPPAPTPAAQKPDTSQEPADEETTARRKRVHDYKNWTYNVGAGANLNSGTTRTWVRQGGFVGAAGVARNANKYLGLRLDFDFANLPLRDSTLEFAQATGASSHVYSLTLDPIINMPVTNLFSAYVLIGPGFYHRSGSLNSDTTIPGSACNAFWDWWGVCQNSNFSIPLSGSFVNSTVNEFGYNVGAGVSRKMPSGVEIYGEFRLMHGSRNGTTTDYRPITIGFRW